MVCENCGAQIEDEVLSVYCKKCGQKILRKDADGQQIEEQEEKKTRKGRKKWYFAAGVGVVLLVGVIVLLVVMQGPEAFRNPGNSGAPGSQAEVTEQLYGEWADENGILSMTFQEDGTVRIGTGSGFLGADLFTFTKGDGGTLYLKANADGVLGEVSLRVDYELQGNEMAVSFLGMDFMLNRK